MVGTSRNSSVGRALDWRSECPRFNPGFRQVVFFSPYSYVILRAGQNKLSLESKIPKSRNSSVGRALDWRSKCPRFNPGFRQCGIFFSVIFYFNVYYDELYLYFNLIVVFFYYNIFYYLIFTPSNICVCQFLDSITEVYGQSSIRKKQTSYFYKFIYCTRITQITINKFKKLCS